LAWLKHTRSSGASNDEEERLTKQDHDKGIDLSEHEASDEEKEPEVVDVDGGPSPKQQSAAEVSMRRTDEESSPDSRLPHLIVVPASVVSNWEREFQTFAPDMKVLKYHGTMEERTEMKHTLRAYLKKQKGAHEVDVILTSISYFQKESSEDRLFLGKLKYDYMVRPAEPLVCWTCCRVCCEITNRTFAFQLIGR
jgi:SNF2-related domain